jgi:hypothetical protein
MAKRKFAVLGRGHGLVVRGLMTDSRPGVAGKIRYRGLSIELRLGGKAASGHQREDFDRSAEHGFHVLLGSYHNVFLAMTERYQELTRDPDAPRGRVLYLKMSLGIFTWTPYTGRSTSCVIATLPATLTSW